MTIFSYHLIVPAEIFKFKIFCTFILSKEGELKFTPFRAEGRLFFGEVH